MGVVRSGAALLLTWWSACRDWLGPSADSTQQTACRRSHRNRGCSWAESGFAGSRIWSLKTRTASNVTSGRLTLVSCTRCRIDPCPAITTRSTDA